MQAICPASSQHRRLFFLPLAGGGHRNTLPDFTRIQDWLAGGGRLILFISLLTVKAEEQLVQG